MQWTVFSQQCHAVANAASESKRPPAKLRRIVPEQLAALPKRYLLDTNKDSKDLEIKTNTAKGRAVFSKRELKANGVLIYGGIAITKAAKDQLLSQDTTNGESTKYLVEVDQEGNAEDGNPAHGNLLHNQFGGLVNEPSKGDTANMVLSVEEIQGEFRAVFITVQDIAANQELTGHYGSTFLRDYIPGTAAVIPDWL